MFGNKTEKTAVKLETIIGPGTHIEGNITTNESVRVDGHIKGQVHGESVVVGQNGVVQGNITANKVTVAGKIQGNISAATTVELLPTGQLYGDISTTKLIVSDGGCFEGNSQMIKKDGQIIEMPTHNGAKKHLKIVGDPVQS